jgi:hypothetical protein
MLAYEAGHETWGAANARYDAAFKAAEPYRRAMKLHAVVDRFGSWMRTIPVDRDTWRGEREFWRATADGSGTLTFHPPDVPIGSGRSRSNPPG